MSMVWEVQRTRIAGRDVVTESARFHAPNAELARQIAEKAPDSMWKEMDRHGACIDLVAQSPRPHFSVSEVRHGTR